MINKNKIISAITATILALPGVMAYPLGIPVMNLWDLFVENLFGSFFIAILFIALIYFIILMLGGISYFTVISFLLFFFLAMTIGYGYSFFTVLIVIGGILYFIWQVFRFIQNM